MNETVADIVYLTEAAGHKRFCDIMTSPAAALAAAIECEAAFTHLPLPLPILASGATRLVFDAEDVVFKIPLARNHVDFDLIGCMGAQFTEAVTSVIGYGDKQRPVAATELRWHHSGVPVIIQERLHTDLNLLGDEERLLPEWAYEVDRGQIGLSVVNGRPLIYDAGEPPDIIDHESEYGRRYHSMIEAYWDGVEFGAGKYRA